MDDELDEALVHVHAVGAVPQIEEHGADDLGPGREGDGEGVRLRVEDVGREAGEGRAWAGDVGS